MPFCNLFMGRPSYIVTFYALIPNSTLFNSGLSIKNYWLIGWNCALKAAYF